jgi:hypothetical protein
MTKTCAPIRLLRLITNTVPLDYTYQSNTIATQITHKLKLNLHVKVPPDSPRNRTIRENRLQDVTASHHEARKNIPRMPQVEHPRLDIQRTHATLKKQRYGPVRIANTDGRMHATCPTRHNHTLRVIDRVRAIAIRDDDPVTRRRANPSHDCRAIAAADPVDIIATHHLHTRVSDSQCCI